jgi:hypothetical protein
MIQIYKNVITKEECDTIIFLSKLNQGYEKHDQRSIRRTKTPLPDKLTSIKDILIKYADLYANENNISYSLMEDMQFIQYDKNDGIFKRHNDGSFRKISALLYLNSLDQGGETIFYTNPIQSIKPEPGLLVLFNPEIDHEALMPISDNKHIVVTWFI